MNKRIIRGASIGFCAGAGLSSGLLAAGSAGETTPTEVVRACANNIGKISLIDALYDNDKCGKYADQFSISPVSTALDGARQTVVVAGPSKEAFLDNELPKAHDAESHDSLEGGLFVGTSPFLYAAVGAWAAKILAKNREDTVPFDAVAEAE